MCAHDGEKDRKNIERFGENHTRINNFKHHVFVDQRARKHEVDVILPVVLILYDFEFTIMFKEKEKERRKKGEKKKWLV